MAVTLLSPSEIRQHTDMPTAIDVVRQAFLDYAGGKFVMPVRTSFGAGRVLVMPVFHKESESAAIKSLRIQLDRNPAITGVIAWTDDSGEVLMDASIVTSIRTGAVVGVATELLAPPDSKRLVLIGAGGQAMDQLRAVLSVRPLEHLTISSRTLESSNSMRRAVLAAYPHLGVDAVTDPSRAVRHADIICCATSSRIPVFDASDLPERVHVNGIGSYTPAMNELPQLLFHGADVVVDSLDAAMSEAGELIGAVAEGIIRTDEVSELGHRLGLPTTRSERTVFKSVGLAIQDWALAGLIARRARDGSSG